MVGIHEQLQTDDLTLMHNVEELLGGVIYHAIKWSLQGILSFDMILIIIGKCTFYRDTEFFVLGNEHKRFEGFESDLYWFLSNNRTILPQNI